MTSKFKLLILPLIAAALAGFCACDDNDDAYDYDGAKFYTAGNGNVSAASEIEIDWIGGDVEISASSEATDIVFEEQSDYTDERYLMHWRLERDVLKIKYTQSGTKPEKNMKKTLSVTVPETVTFREIDVNSVSGGITINGVKTADCELETVSGNVYLANVTAPVLHAESVSGKISAGEGVYGSVEFKTVSGDIAFDNGDYPLRSFEADSVSGNVRIQTRRCPASADIETTSGDAEFTFTEGAGFALTFRTVSGTFESQFETTKSGNTYTAAGDGNGVIRVETTSGDVNVIKNANG